MRERVPLVFMAVSVAATLALGGAIAYQFAHQERSTAVQQAAAPLQPATGGVKAQTHASSGNPTSGSAAPSGSPVAHTSSSSPSGGAGTKSSSSGSHSTRAASSQQVVRHHGGITAGGIYDETGRIAASVERDPVRSYFSLVELEGGVHGRRPRLLAC